MKDLVHALRDRWKAALKYVFDRADVQDQAVGENNFRLLAENCSDVIFRVDHRGIALYVSQSSTRILGWTPEEIIGRGPAGFIHPEDIHKISMPGEMKDAENSTTTVRFLKRDGTTIWVEATSQTFCDPADESGRGAVLVARDITDRKMLEDQLTALALTDNLTGLANRRAFDADLEREWQRVLRDEGEMSLLLLDLDHFKEFNDRYGHQVGDDCLRAIGATLKNIARPCDTAARYGGEEFALILGNTGVTVATTIAETVRASIAALALPHSENIGGGGYVTASIGVASALSRTGGTAKMPQGLLSAADTALYKAKYEGRNRVGTALLILPHEGSIVPTDQPISESQSQISVVTNSATEHN